MASIRDFPLQFCGKGPQARNEFLMTVERIRDTRQEIENSMEAGQGTWGARPSMVELAVFDSFPFWDLVCSPCRVMGGEIKAAMPLNIPWVTATMCLESNMAAQFLIAGTIRDAVQTTLELEPDNPVASKVWEYVKISIDACRVACQKEAINYQMSKPLFNSIHGAEEYRAIIAAHYLRRYINHYEVCYKKLDVLLDNMDRLIFLKSGDKLTEEQKKDAMSELENFMAKTPEQYRMSGPQCKTYSALCTDGGDGLTFDIQVATPNLLTAEFQTEFKKFLDYMNTRLGKLEVVSRENPQYLHNLREDYFGIHGVRRGRGDQADALQESDGSNGKRSHGEEDLQC